MQTPRKPSFGHDLIEAMKLVLAHHRGDIKLERVLPKRRSSHAAAKQQTQQAK
jgi:hypothetical protein